MPLATALDPCTRPAGDNNCSESCDEGSDNGTAGIHEAPLTDDVIRSMVKALWDGIASEAPGAPSR